LEVKASISQSGLPVSFAVFYQISHVLFESQLVRGKVLAVVLKVDDLLRNVKHAGQA
jgi:uncharacterized protein YqcC (DUF446 family)